MAASTRRRVLWTLAVVGLFATVIVSALATHVEDVRDTPMAPLQPGWNPQVIPLLETAGPPPPIYLLWLHLDDPRVFLGHREIRILFTTYWSRVHFTGATLAVLGTSCVYETRPGARLVNDDMLAFGQGPECNPLRGAPTGEVKLTVRLAARNRIGVWTFVPPSGEASSSSQLIRVVGVPGRSGPFPALRGKYVDRLAPTGTRRIDLLGYMWQVAPSSRWIWWAFGLSVLVALVGALLFPWDLRNNLVGLTPAVAAGAGMLCLAAALGGMYAVLVPPFQAPDEPDHFLSYALLTQDTSLADEAARWARLSHFERIKFHTDDRFRPDDVGKPFPIAWSVDTFADNVKERSSTTAAWWTYLSRFVHSLPAPRKLLFVRLADVFVFALSVAAGTLLLVWAAGPDIPYPQLLPSVFLLVPALPFFAMTMSEFALLTSGYVFLAACTLALFVDGPRSSWFGIPLGFVVAMLAMSGRSALPMAPLITAVVAARIALGERSVKHASGDFFRSTLFWTGFTLSVGAVSLMLDAEYAPPAIDLTVPIAQRMVLPWFRLVWHRPWYLATLGAIAFALELSAVRVRGWIPERITAKTGTAARWACFAGAALVVLSFAGSLFLTYPHLQLLEVPDPPSLEEYLRNVLQTAVSSFRTGDLDFLLSSSFWAGFGWLDTVPDSIFLAVLTGGVGLSLIALLAHVGRQRDTRRVAWLAIVGIGWVVTLATYAIATYEMHRNLHGRYLIGVYLVVLAVVFSGLALAGPIASKRCSISRPAVVLWLAGAAHTYCLWFILGRYF